MAKKAKKTEFKKMRGLVLVHEDLVPPESLDGYSEKEIQEWKSDTYQNTALHYSVTVLVLDPSGQELGRAAINGNDNLGGSFWAPAGYAEDNVPPAYAQKLEQLLNDPAILRALAPAPSGPPPPQPAAPPTEPSVTVPSS